MPLQTFKKVILVAPEGSGKKPSISRLDKSVTEN